MMDESTLQTLAQEIETMQLDEAADGRPNHKPSGFDQEKQKKQALLKKVMDF